jgi:parallel beta-helix repeat protein
MTTYTKQQVRWTRNSWRSDIVSLGSRWLWKNPFLAFHTVDRFFQPFTLILGPMFLFIALYRGDWVVALILVAWWLLSRSMKIAPHLLKHPKDLLILPAHIAYSYLIAVVKIYTLTTVDEQSWITRWSKDRIAVTGSLRRIVSYAATSSIVFLLFFLSFQYNVRLTGAVSFLEKSRLEKIEAQKKMYPAEENSRLISLTDKKFQNHYDFLYQKVNSDPYGYYQAGFGETLNDIRRKFLLSPDAIVLKENKDPIAGNYYLKYQERVAIPIQYLRNPDLDYHRNLSQMRVQVTYDFSEDAVRIRGKGAFVGMTALAQAINNRNVLENLGNKEWILRRNLFIDDGVTLVVDGNEAEWLKLKSGPKGFAWIKAEGGNIFISNAKVTSWDEDKSGYDLEWQDGRSYILQKTAGRMDIIKSELAYLGYPGHPNRGNPFGGPYGISWKIQDNALRNELSTGSVKESSIHHNYFGIYTFGTTGALFSNNNVYENVEYGIDPHDDSNNLLIKDNYVFKNGNHGIIASRRCSFNIIRGNYSQENKLHGIMLDRESNYNLVENNYSEGNVNGIALNNSSGNLVINNWFRENQYGIRANNFSKSNYFGYNLIDGSQKAIYIYSDSGENYISQSEFLENKINIHLKKNSENFISKEWVEKLSEIK